MSAHDDRQHLSGGDSTGAGKDGKNGYGIGGMDKQLPPATFGGGECAGKCNFIYAAARGEEEGDEIVPVGVANTEEET